jgi:hypothetical protein
MGAVSLAAFGTAETSSTALWLVIGSATVFLCASAIWRLFTQDRKL